MHNSLRDSFNSHRSKALFTLAILATTSGALFSDLKAQTSNNGANPKMEQVDKNDAKIVADFTKPLGVTIPAKWTKFASDAIQMLDADGVASAQMILNQDLPKVEAADRPAYVLMAFDAIRKAYDKEDHMEAATEFAVEYVTYGDGITSITGRFAEDRNKRSDIYINQKKENINQKKENINQMDKEIAQKKENINQKKENINQMDKEIAQNKQEIAQNKQEIAQKNKLAEDGLIKLYELDPTNPKVKNMAKELRDFFKDTNYSRSDKTNKIFTELNIK